MTLSDRIIAGQASNEEVGRALGWTSAPDGYGEGNDWYDPEGNRMKRVGRYGCPPPFLSDIRASIVEIERRGLLWRKAPRPLSGELKPAIWVGVPYPGRWWFAATDGTLSGDTRALAAALAAAVEAQASDHIADAGKMVAAVEGENNG